jgi:hypothetical protein
MRLIPLIIAVLVLSVGPRAPSQKQQVTLERPGPSQARLTIPTEKRPPIVVLLSEDGDELATRPDSGRRGHSDRLSAISEKVNA